MDLNFIMDPNPPAPWSEAKVITAGSITGTNLKPAMCEHDSHVFLAWATSGPDMLTPATTFSFTTWLASDDGWAVPKLVPLKTGTTQSQTSALVVFNNVLYAFVPYVAIDGSSSGLLIFSYVETTETFVSCGEWSETWNTPVAAVVCDGTLHVVGYNSSASNHLVWTWSDPDTKTITGPGGFSANTQIDEQTSSNPALIVRDGQVRVLYLADTDNRGVLENTLTMGSNPTWTRTDNLDENGNSGVSAAATPDGKHAWICFKKHSGDSNLICHYKNAGSGCWSSNQSMGSGGILFCANEAALVYSKEWLYAAWNSIQPGQPIYYSRRPVRQMDPANWMADLNNQSVSLAALSLPGTHDSATYGFKNGLLIADRVECQHMSITQQLDAGVRYFDLRVDYTTTKLNATPVIGMFHGSFYLGRTLPEVLQFFYSWLAVHSSEAVVIQIKHEGLDATEQKISDDIYTLISGNSNWITTGTIPTLSQACGKIQLVRRFLLPTTCKSTSQVFGVDATGWKYNQQFTVTNDTNDATNPTISLYVEDNCEYDRSGTDALNSKTEAVQAFVQAAASAAIASDVWYIGYTSYVTEFGFGKIPASNEHYATYPIAGHTAMNVALEKFVKAQGGFGKPARVGTLVMDYPEEPKGTLIDRIIYTNDIKKSW